ncbi:hypothetical protein ATANTOWER_010023 [Ataeniobius toweri]|uniref:Uncharacterized protein n=1 Tax=Ataeniobius toweri TaxID=208326 RepID=A0ABU7AGF1_9TELE|nr:hypothetical protein [Ataeniobius toweri]
MPHCISAASTILYTCSSQTLISLNSEVKVVPYSTLVSYSTFQVKIDNICCGFLWILQIAKFNVAFHSPQKSKLASGDDFTPDLNLIPSQISKQCSLRFDKLSDHVNYHK